MKLRMAVLMAFVLSLNPGSARAQDAVEYYHLDGLGSVRAVSDQAGNPVERHDYLPFGEEWSLPGPRADSAPIRFTGKERDTETGLDYFAARYYRAGIARFTTIDPVHTWQENLVDPQRWNRYAYARSNPLRFVDPTGLAIELLGNAAERGFTLGRLKEGIGATAGAYLYENAVEDGRGGVRYFVGFYKGGPTGQGPLFGELPGTRDVEALVTAPEIIAIGIARKGDSAAGYTIGPLGFLSQPGITDTDIKARTSRISLLQPGVHPGTLPAFAMSDGKPGYLNFAINLYHELGHAGFDLGILAGSDSNDRAVELENAARARVAPGAYRTGHW